MKFFNEIFTKSCTSSITSESYPDSNTKQLKQLERNPRKILSLQQAVSFQVLQLGEHVNVYICAYMYITYEIKELLDFV